MHWARAAVRASAHTPEPADLARTDQDLRKQIAAQTGLLRSNARQESDRLKVA